MPKQSTLKELLINFSNSFSDEVFEVFYKKLYPLAYHTAFYITNNNADTEDVVQLSFLSVYKGIHHCKALQEESDQKIKSWFLSIVYNQAKMSIRKKVRGRSQESKASQNRLNQDPEERIMLSEDEVQIHKNLKNAIESLPEKYRTPILLKYKNGLEYDSIAEILSLNHSTLRNRISRGISYLKIKLKATEDDINKILPSLCIIPFLELPQKIHIPKFNPRISTRLPRSKKTKFFSLKTLLITLSFIALGSFAWHYQQRLQPTALTPKSLTPKEPIIIDFSDGQLGSVSILQGQFEYKNQKRYTQDEKYGEWQNGVYITASESIRTFISFKNYHLKIPCKVSIHGGPFFVKKDAKALYTAQGCYTKNDLLKRGVDIFYHTRNLSRSRKNPQKYTEEQYFYHKDYVEIYYLHEYIVTKYTDGITKISKHNLLDSENAELGLILASYAIEKIVLEEIGEQAVEKLKANIKDLINSPQNELRHD